MEWRIMGISHRLSLPLSLAGMWVRVVHSININSPGHNLAITHEYDDN